MGRFTDKEQRKKDRNDAITSNRQIASKTNLAVSSIEFCQCTFDEREIEIRLGSGHGVMIPPCAKLSLNYRFELLK